MDEDAGAGAGVGEGVEEREGTKIGVEGRDIVVMRSEEDEDSEELLGGWGLSRVLFILEVAQP